MMDNQREDLEWEPNLRMEQRMQVLGLPQEDIDILEEIKYGGLNTRRGRDRLV